jgi:hypothetical protein
MHILVHIAHNLTHRVHYSYKLASFFIGLEDVGKRFFYVHNTTCTTG